MLKKLFPIILILASFSLLAMEPATESSSATKNNDEQRAKILYSLAEGSYYGTHSSSRNIDQAIKYYQQIIDLPVLSVYKLLAFDRLALTIDNATEQEKLHICESQYFFDLLKNKFHSSEKELQNEIANVISITAKKIIGKLDRNLENIFQYGNSYNAGMIRDKNALTYYYNILCNWLKSPDEREGITLFSDWFHELAKNYPLTLPTQFDTSSIDQRHQKWILMVKEDTFPRFNFLTQSFKTHKNMIQSLWNDVVKIYIEKGRYKYISSILNETATMNCCVNVNCHKAKLKQQSLLILGYFYFRGNVPEVKKNFKTALTYFEPVEQELLSELKNNSLILYQKENLLKVSWMLAQIYVSRNDNHLLIRNTEKAKKYAQRTLKWSQQLQNNQIKEYAQKLLQAINNEEEINQKNRNICVERINSANPRIALPAYLRLGVKCVTGDGCSDNKPSYLYAEYCLKQVVESNDATPEEKIYAYDWLGYIYKMGYQGHIPGRPGQPNIDAFNKDIQKAREYYTQVAEQNILPEAKESAIEHLKEIDTLESN